MPAAPPRGWPYAALEDQGKLGSRWLGCLVSKARGLRLQLRGPSSRTTYHVGGLDERGMPPRSLAIYRARGRSYRLTSCLGGRVAGGASLASRVSRDFGSWCFPFPVGSLLITELFRRLQWAGYRFCDVPRELALRGYLSRKAGFGALGAFGRGSVGPGFFPSAKAPESAGTTVFLSSSPTAPYLSDPALLAV